jgi:hypothetical protein
LEGLPLGNPFEILMDPLMDFNSDAGFAYAVHLALKTLENSMLAPVCSSWVNINQGTAGRNKAFPLGDRRHLYVQGANLMVIRGLSMGLVGMVLVKGSCC